MYNKRPTISDLRRKPRWTMKDVVENFAGGRTYEEVKEQVLEKVEVKNG